MKIRPVGAELFHSDGWTDGQTDAHDKAHGRVFVILQTRQKNDVRTQTIFIVSKTIHSGHFLTQPPDNGKDLTNTVTYELLRYSYIWGFF